MTEELEQLRKDLLKYKQTFLFLEESLYEAQIEINEALPVIGEKGLRRIQECILTMSTILDEVLDPEEHTKGNEP